MKGARFILLIPVVLVVAWAIRSWIGPPETKKDRVKQEEEKAIRVIQDLCTKHEADASWMNIFEETPYTLTIQRAIVRPTGGKKVVLGTIGDVWKEGDDYLIDVRVDLLEIGLFYDREFYCQLQCTPEQVEQLLARRSDELYNIFAIVFVPHRVVRRSPHYRPFVESEEEGISYEPVATVSMMGRCVEIVDIGDVFISINSLKTGQAQSDR